MWILKFLPDWIFYFILIAGVVGLVITHFIRLIPIPFIYMYKTPIQLASVLAIAFGTFMSGAIYNDHAWLERVREMEAKVAAAEAKSAETNVQIVEKIVYDTKVVRERGAEVIKYIDKEIVKYDSMCTIPEEFIITINKVAEQPQ